VFYTECKKLYTFFNDKITKNKHQHFNLSKQQYSNIKIVYQSDDFQDILDVFKALKETDKYNL